MGSALARYAVRAGHETHVWNRSAAKLAPLVAIGAKAAASARAAVEAADIVVVMVSERAASQRVVDEVAVVLAGKLLVDLTSGTPRQARERAAWAKARGIAVLDGAVMVTRDVVGTERCVVLYAGERALMEKHAVLGFGGRAIHVGEEPGGAAALDVALITTMWGALFGALQAAVVCRAEGIPVETLIGYLGALEPVTRSAVAGQLECVARGRFGADATTKASVAVHRAGVKHLRAVCEERGLSAAIPEAFAALLEAAVAAGHAEDELAVVTRFMA